MLSLTRKEGERIRIDGGIIVELSKIKGNRVIVRIDAPPSVRILRDELPDPDRGESSCNAAPAA